MLRVSLLVFVSGCAPAVSAVSTVSVTSATSPNPSFGPTEAPREGNAAPPERAARLAPPFGRSAGVRRVTASNDTAATDPAVVASIEPRD
jgi:hypothetical protein